MKSLHFFSRSVSMAASFLLILSGAISCTFDDTELQNSIDDLTARIEALENFQEQVQGDIASLQEIIAKLQSSVTVNNVVETENGYTINFSDGTSVTISNGKDGMTPPSITVVEEGGTYYWAYENADGTTEFIRDGDGNKIPVTGEAPQVRINEETGNWEISTDGGKTWSDYETIFPEEGTFSRQPIQVLKNGRWIYGTWICTDAVDGLAGDPSAFRISDDQGKTWRQVMMPNSRGRVHATVVELDDGHLVAFMRSREADFIYRSESFDWGDSWSEPKPTVLPNNNSSISAIRTQSGRIAIAYNPTSVSEDMRSKCAWPGLRCPVAVALSEDGGLTFPMIRWMERGEGYIGDENKTNNKQYEYPYIMQGADGRLHLTYAAFTRKAVKYVSFTEADVMGAKRERYGVYNPTNGEGARDAR